MAAALGKASVVIIASAACSPPSEVNCRSVIPRSTFSMGSRCPMTPVEHTSTSSLGIRSFDAILLAICMVSVNPTCPVQALALPLLQMMAWARPRPTMAWLYRIEGALTTLVVKTPAAELTPCCENMPARSDFPEGLMPAVVAPATKPKGAATPPSMDW